MYVVVRTSGMSSKLYEYRAAGKPIIRYAEGQPADYVEDTGSGMDRILPHLDNLSSFRGQLYLV